MNTFSLDQQQQQQQPLYPQMPLPQIQPRPTQKVGLSVNAQVIVPLKKTKYLINLKIGDKLETASCYYHELLAYHMRVRYGAKLPVFPPKYIFSNMNTHSNIQFRATEFFNYFNLTLQQPALLLKLRSFFLEIGFSSEMVALILANAKAVQFNYQLNFCSTDAERIRLQQQFYPNVKYVYVQQPQQQLPQPPTTTAPPQPLQPQIDARAQLTEMFPNVDKEIINVTLAGSNNNVIEAIERLVAISSQEQMVQQQQPQPQQQQPQQQPQPQPQPLIQFPQEHFTYPQNPNYF